MLELDQVGKQVDGVQVLDNINLSLSAGQINVLLGPTLSGKTSLLRLMAGLDKPGAGDIRFAGKSVVGVPVQKRNVAMVYQQFINYPSLSVYDNIASPLRVARTDKKTIEKKVAVAAQRLKIEELLDRTPAQLSGGQQQRVALARALVKEADLVLLDEPLANLDYKLREELREELPRLFSEQGALLVYATTEPGEALLLGGNTAVLHEGKLSQFGQTLEVFQAPQNIDTAQVFSDPPLNTFEVTKTAQHIQLAELEIPLTARLATLTDSNYRIGIRPHHISLQRSPEYGVEVTGRVTVNEITGSESFIHFEFAGSPWIALAHGIYATAPGESIQFYLNPESFYYFYPDGALALAPRDRAA